MEIKFKIKFMLPVVDKLEKILVNFIAIVVM